MGLFDRESRNLLGQAKNLFKDARNQSNELLQRIDEDLRFAAGEQWDPTAKRVLELENRPALTFNLVQQVVREFVGANEDVRKRMRAVPVGTEDLAASELIDHVWQRLYQESDVPSIEREVFEKAIIAGTCTIFLDLEPSRNNPGYWDLVVESLSPSEVIWDPESEKSDYSDARYVFWTRWISEADFRQDYGGGTSRFEELVASQGHSGGDAGLVNRHMELVRTEGNIVLESELLDTDFFRTDEKILRIVHLEYIEPWERFWVFNRGRDEQTAEPKGWTEIDRQLYRLLRAADIQEIRRTWDRQVRWLEFTGTDVLFDDVQPLPLSRFALVPLNAFFDWATKRPYGVVHPLKDSQREVNKRYSYELDLTLRQVQPGAIVEEDAITDSNEFERQTRTPGATAVVKSGTLVEGRYQERTVPQLPAAAADLGERAFQNFNRVAGFMLDPLLGERSREEPVGTALLKHRRSLMAITPILENFRRFQRQTLTAILELVTGAFSDRQIMDLLGDRQRYSVRGGAVADREREAIIPVRDLRKYRWQIELQAHADDTTGQVMLLQTLVGASQAGIPVDPAIMVEFLPLPGDMKERARLFIARQLEQQQQQQQAELQLQARAQETQEASVQNLLQTEAAKVQQREISSQRTAEIQRVKALLDFVAKIAKQTAEQGGQERDRQLELVRIAASEASEQLRQVESSGGVG